jgi:hypothetical protein
LEVLDARGRGLQVTFSKDGDRFVHDIADVFPNGSAVLLAVDLGREFDPWPRSPALQQLSLDRLSDGRRIALLVGMAGTSHWSVSVEPQDAPLGFCFDVACRMQRTPQWLGSSYRAHQPIEVISATAVRLVAGGVWCCVVSEASDRTCLSTFEVAGHQLAIAPRSRPSDLPGTARWKYRILLEE